MKYCTKCGNKIEGNAQFCTKCGARLEVSDSKASSAGNNDGKKPNNLLVPIVAVVLLLLLVVVGKGIFSHKGSEAAKDNTESAKASEKSEEKSKEKSEEKSKGSDKKAKEETDFGYEITDNGVTIIRYKGTDKKVTVPSKIEGVKVVEIGEKAFTEKDVEEVVLNEGITTIKSTAFARCFVQKVTLPKSLKTIEGYAFANTEYIKEITIPAGVTVIGDSAFARSKIEKITFQKGKEKASIGEGAFAECKNLGEIVIPGNYLAIGRYAFSYTAMNSFTWEKATVDGSKLLGDNAFYKSEVESVDISMEIPEIEENCFFQCEKLATVKLPKSIEIIGKVAFDQNDIETIELPEGLKIIDEGAFAGCTYLKEIVIPSTVEEIRSNAFSGTGLEKITFKEGKNPASLGQDALGNENKLTEVIIPKNYTYVYLPYGESLSLIKWEGDKKAFPEYFLLGRYDCPQTDYELEIFLPDGVEYKEDGQPDYNGWRCAEGYFEPIGYGNVVVHIDRGNPLTVNPRYEGREGLTFEYYD